MGRELKKVFTNEQTDKFMASIFTAEEGFGLSTMDQLNLEESKTLINHMWNVIKAFINMSGLAEFFEHYCAAQRGELKEKEKEERIDINEEN